MSNIHPAKTKRPAEATRPLAAWANATATRAARFGGVIVGRTDVFKSCRPAKDDRSTSITGRSSAGDDRLWETSHGALSSLYSPPTLNNGCDSPACAGLVQRHRPHGPLLRQVRPEQRFRRTPPESWLQTPTARMLSRRSRMDHSRLWILHQAREEWRTSVATDATRSLRPRRPVPRMGLGQD